MVQLVLVLLSLMQANNVKLVPKFQENKVEEFFQHFEKVAVSLEWPKSVWPTLIQCSLVGKAQEVYASLSVEECADYEGLLTLGLIPLGLISRWAITIRAKPTWSIFHLV